ncbi:MAG TPA: carboxypeptidase-like regulatory domain-containing protein [Terriglobia bacterium]|nr:carboxypeptidase-like regulatory domain-containing protein [Terriglobia bacterium]
MIAVLLVTAIMAIQGAERLQPGTGIVMGSLKTPDGKPAAGVRVGALDVDDPTGSSLLSVAETDSSGRFRLINIPEGNYYIVAGRLSELRYYPAGTDRSAATQVRIEPARVRSDVNFTVPPSSERPQSGSRALPMANLTYEQMRAEEKAYQQITAEKTLERKAQLVAQFEKSFPWSPRRIGIYLSMMSEYSGRNDAVHTVEYGDKAVKGDPGNARTLMQVSRTFAGLKGQTLPIDKALAYAEKAVVLAKGQSIEPSARENLAWVQQIEAWQRRSLFSLVAPKGR